MASLRSVLLVTICFAVTLPAMPQAHAETWFDQIFNSGKQSEYERRRQARIRKLRREAAERRRKRAAARKRKQQEAAKKRKQAAKKKKRNDGKKRDEARERSTDREQDETIRSFTRKLKEKQRRKRKLNLPPEAIQEDAREMAERERMGTPGPKKPVAQKKKKPKKKLEINFYRDEKNKKVRRNRRIYRPRRQKGEARHVTIRMRENVGFIDQTHPGDLSRAYYQQLRSDLLSFQDCRSDQKECKRIRKKAIPGVLLQNVEKFRYKNGFSMHNFTKAKMCYPEKTRVSKVPRRLHRRDHQFVMPYKYNDANIQELKRVFGLPDDYAVYVQSIDAKFDNLQHVNPFPFQVSERLEDAIMHCDLLMTDYEKLKIVRRIEYGRVFIRMHIDSSTPAKDIKKMVRSMQNFVGYNLWVRFNGSEGAIELRSNKDDLMIGMHTIDWTPLMERDLRGTIDRYREYVRE